MKQESVKRIFDHKQQQFVEVPSLVDKAADVYVASQLVPACKQLSGTNMDTFGSEIITKQLSKLPDELRPLIITKLLPHASELGWKIRFREKAKKREKDKKKRILYVDENFCVKRKSIWKNSKFDHAQLMFMDKLRVERLSRKLSENGLMRGVCACFDRKTQEIPYDIQLRRVINSIIRKRFTSDEIFREFYCSPDRNFLIGLLCDRRNPCVFNTENFNKIQELDASNKYIDSLVFIGGKNLVMSPPNILGGECIMWEYNEREKIFRVLESGIYFPGNAYEKSLDCIKGVETEQDVLAKRWRKSNVDYAKHLTFYQHFENISEMYWLPIQHIQNQQDIIFSDDKQTCIALQLDLKTVDFYQRIEGEWRIVSTIALEKPIRCLKRLTSNFLIGASEYDRGLNIDINTGKVLSRFYYRETEDKITFDLPYELVLASIAKSNDYKKHNQKGLKALLSSRALMSDATNDQLNDYKKQLTDQIETSIRRSSSMLRFAKFAYMRNSGKAASGLGLGAFIFNTALCYKIFSNLDPKGEGLLGASCLGGFLGTCAFFGILDPVTMYFYDGINKSDQRWLGKRKYS